MEAPGAYQPHLQHDAFRNTKHNAVRKEKDHESWDEVKKKTHAC